MTAGLARALELPEPAGCGATASAPMAKSPRRSSTELKKGVEVDGVKYMVRSTPPWSATTAPMSGWYLRSAKARTAKSATSWRTWPRGEPADPGVLRSVPARRTREGQVEEVKTRVLREQLGEKIATLAGAGLHRPMPGRRASAEPAMTRRGQEKAVQAGRKKRSDRRPQGPPHLWQRTAATKPAPATRRSQRLRPATPPRGLSRQARFEARDE